MQMHNPAHPGQVIKKLYLEPLGLSITRFAEHLHVDRKTISRIINGQSSISLEMAVKLGKAFGDGAQIWLDMQTQYDLWQAQNNPEFQFDEIERIVTA